MRKNSSQGKAMTDVAFVDQAEGWAKRLTQSEARGPGDMENAWRRLEARYGVPWRTFWALRYRKPRDITASAYHRLAAAYAAECGRQVKLLRHEIAITKLVAGPDHPAVAASEAVLDALPSSPPDAEDI